MKGLESKTIKLESGTELTVRGLKGKQVLQLNQTLPANMQVDAKGGVDIKSASGTIQAVMDYVTDKACIEPTIQSDDEAYFIEKDEREDISFEKMASIVEAVFSLSYGDAGTQKKSKKK